MDHLQSSHSLSALCPQALLLPFSEIKKGVATGFCPLFQRGEGEVVSLFRVTTVTTWTNTHNEQHTDCRWKEVRDGNQEKGRRMDEHRA